VPANATGRISASARDAPSVLSLYPQWHSAQAGSCAEGTSVPLASTASVMVQVISAKALLAGCQCDSDSDSVGGQLTALQSALGRYQGDPTTRAIF